MQCLENTVREGFETFFCKLFAFTLFHTGGGGDQMRAIFASVLTRLFNSIGNMGPRHFIPCSNGTSTIQRNCLLTTHCMIGSFKLASYLNMHKLHDDMYYWKFKRRLVI